MARTFETASGATITPEVRVAWSAEWMGDAGYITSSFLGAPGSAYRTAAADQRYNAMLLDAGVTVRLRGRLSLTARAGTELLRPGHEAQAASVGIKFTF